MPRRKIDGTYRRKFGLPADTLGLNYQKDAVIFYDNYVAPLWEIEGQRNPEPFEITRDLLERFGVQRKRLTPMSNPPTKAEIVLRGQELTHFRLGINRAITSGNVSKVIDHPYQIMPYFRGEVYRVMTLEQGIADGYLTDKIEGFAVAKKKKVTQMYQAVREENHTPRELQDLLAKARSDDQLFRGLQKTIDNTRSRVALSPPIKRLKKWSHEE